jgi:putative Holliday junction resolvase
VVALDYGRRRVGVAVTDPGRVLATPHSAIGAGIPPVEPADELLQLLRELEAREIVVGVPLNMDGSEGEMAREARRFAARLAERTGLQVHQRDERLSSVEADRMLAELDLPRRRRREKGSRDAMAAAVLLRDFLEEG